MRNEKSSIHYFKYLHNTNEYTPSPTKKERNY